MESSCVQDSVKVQFNHGYYHRPPTPPTTTEETTLLPTTEPGCVYNGKRYPLDTKIEHGEDRSSNWCWFYHCGADGEVLHGDNFNCFPTTVTPTTSETTPDEPTTEPMTTEPTTTPTTALPTTTPQCCVDENGNSHHPGSEISSGRSGNWCYWQICGQDCEIVMADDFDCDK